MYRGESQRQVAFYNLGKELKLIGVTFKHYSMYLDDGVSRDSAPADLPQHRYSRAATSTTSEAKSYFREVKIHQVCPVH